MKKEKEAMNAGVTGGLTEELGEGREDRDRECG